LLIKAIASFFCVWLLFGISLLKKGLIMNISKISNNYFFKPQNLKNLPAPQTSSKSMQYSGISSVAANAMKALALVALITAYSCKKDEPVLPKETVYFPTSQMNLIKNNTYTGDSAIIQDNKIGLDYVIATQNETTEIRNSGSNRFYISPVSENSSLIIKQYPLSEKVASVILGDGVKEDYKLVLNLKNKNDKVLEMTNDKTGNKVYCHFMDMSTSNSETEQIVRKMFYWNPATTPVMPHGLISFQDGSFYQGTDDKELPLIVTK
jgi:hypothetical protein